MQLRPDIALQSVLKAMNDVVLPAIDPNNPLAQEQARLCMGLIGVVSSRLPLQFRYDCDELARLSHLSQRLQQTPALEHLAPAESDALARSAQAADDVLARAQADPADVLAAIRALRRATGDLVQEVFQRDGQGAPARALQRAVLDATQAQLQRERAWLVPQGWEPEPQALPAIESLLRPVSPAD